MPTVPKPRRGLQGFKSEEGPHEPGVLADLWASLPKHAPDCATRTAGGNWPCTCGVIPRDDASGENIP